MYSKLLQDTIGVCFIMRFELKDSDFLIILYSTVQFENSSMNIIT